MKKIIVAAVVAVIIAVAAVFFFKPVNAGILGMICTNAGSSIERCEDGYAICYVKGGNSISCIHK